MLKIQQIKVKKGVTVRKKFMNNLLIMKIQEI